MVVKSFCKILKATSAYTENTDQMFIIKKKYPSRYTVPF
jgi:hypothetical protein